MRDEALSFFLGASRDTARHRSSAKIWEKARKMRPKGQVTGFFESLANGLRSFDCLSFWYHDFR